MPRADRPRRNLRQISLPLRAPTSRISGPYPYRDGKPADKRAVVVNGGLRTEAANCRESRNRVLMA